MVLTGQSESGWELCYIPLLHCFKRR